MAQHKSSPRNHYHYSNSKGRCPLPTKEQVTEAELNNCPFILIPDKNVCIHISELTSKLNKDELKKLKASALLKYLYESQITIVSAFGLIERALKPRTLKINLDKLNDFDLIFQECIGATGRLSSSIIEDFEIFKYILYPHYAYLLAIKIIEFKRQ